jgi:hemerythrin
MVEELRRFVKNLPCLATTPTKAEIEHKACKVLPDKRFTAFWPCRFCRFVSRWSSFYGLRQAKESDWWGVVVRYRGGSPAGHRVGVTPAWMVLCPPKRSVCRQALSSHLPESDLGYVVVATCVTAIATFLADLKKRAVGRAVVTNSPPAIQWRDYYCVGNRDLDGEHQEIVFIINWLYEVIWEGDDPAALPTLMRRLSEYTHSHFVHEESMMREAGFPGYVGLGHKKIHDKLASDTSDLLFGSLQEDGPDSREVLAFLKQWWINHITGDDKEYMYYLAEQKRTGLILSGVERRLSESHLDQAIKTDVIEVWNLLGRLSQGTASHRSLLRSLAE